MKRFAQAALAAVVVMAAAGMAAGQTVDEVLKNMSAKAETIKSLNVSANVTKYDATFEKTKTHRMELWYKSPDQTRVDTFKKAGTVEVQTALVIIGKDYVLNCNPEGKTGERYRYAAEDMKRAREERNDPITLIQRKPDDLKKDYDITLGASTRPACVKLTLKPKNPNLIEYQSVELDVNRGTWLPDAAKVYPKADPANWVLYEFTKVLVNPFLPDTVFADPAGYKIQDVKPKAEPAPAKPK